MTTFDSRSQEYRQFIQDYLSDFYGDYRDQPQRRLFEAMRYSLLAGGKRLRPILAFEFCRMCGADWKKAAPFAAAVEMIHTYSLIHDDLPCMDNDDLRRGKPTNHKVYGEALSLLAGDALLTDAFAMASQADFADSNQQRLAFGVLSECAGSYGMVGGQVLDILSEERECTEQEILDIQSRKTGALINAACVLGVLAGSGTEAQIAAAAGYAGAMGLAFQIRDDMLDVIGSAQELGKSIGTDASKNTFVRLFGLEKCEVLVEKHTAIALKMLEAFPDNGYMQALTKSMVGRTA